MLRHRYILFPSKLPTDDSSRCGFPRHIIPRIPSPWKDAIVEIATTTARLGKSPHTTPIPAIMVTATAKYSFSSSPSTNYDTLCYYNAKDYFNCALKNWEDTIYANLSPP